MKHVYIIWHKYYTPDGFGKEIYKVFDEKKKAEFFFLNLKPVERTSSSWHELEEVLVES